MQSFEENLSNLKFVTFDVETTGSNTKESHCVEIAALCFDEDFEHRTFESLIKPPIPISPEISAIHGITDEMVIGSDSSREVFPRFFEFLSLLGTPRILIAHNAFFDVSMIGYEWKRQNVSLLPSISLGTLLEGPSEIVLDSCMLAKNLLTMLPNHKLANLATHFQVPAPNLHRALSDVKVLKEVFLKLIGVLADKNGGAPLTLQTLIEACGGYYLFHMGSGKFQFKLPSRIEQLEILCGTDVKISIQYETEEDYRYITPVKVRVHQFKVYIDAFCHRDQIQKTFRADRVIKIGKIGEF